MSLNDIHGSPESLWVLGPGLSTLPDNPGDSRV